MRLSCDDSSDLFGSFRGVQFAKLLGWNHTSGNNWDSMQLCCKRFNLMLSLCLAPSHPGLLRHAHFLFVPFLLGTHLNLTKSRCVFTMFWGETDGWLRKSFASVHVPDLSEGSLGAVENLEFTPHGGVRCRIRCCPGWVNGHDHSVRGHLQQLANPL